MRFGRQVGGEVFGWWAANPFQTRDGRLWVGVQAYAPDGIDSVRFLVSGLGATTILEPELHADRGLRAYWLSLRQSDVQANTVTVTAVVIPKGSHEPLESVGLTVGKRGTAWDAERYENGWTRLTPSPDSRLIYVSNDGNNAAAANVHGRGYYLPSDPEIGDDPTNPVGPIVAYGSVVEASKRFRGRNWNGTDAPGGIALYTFNATPDRNGYPDWLLFRRGQSFNMPTVPTFGGDQTRTPATLIGNWVQSQYSYQGGGASGRSESEPAVIGAWGPASDARPVIDHFGVDGSSRNMALVSVEVPNSLWWDYSRDGNTADNLLIEDVKARSFGAANTTNMKNARLRRCVVTGSFSGASHNQGLFLGGTDTVTIEECVFDRNGYKEDPADATTWTAGVVSSQVVGALPAGSGVQPTRTYFDRNLYLSSYESMTLRGNIFSRDGGGSSVQMGRGGVCERNLFIWNEMALTTARGSSSTVYDAIVKDNVALHDDHLLPPGGWGVGLQLMGVLNTTHVADSNVIAHFHRGNNGQGSISASGKNVGSGVPQSQLSKAVIVDNAIHHEFNTTGITIEPTTHNGSDGGTGVGVLSATVTGNDVATSGIVSAQGDPSKPSTYTYGNNQFWSGGATPFRWAWYLNGDKDYRFAPNTNGTFSQWQSAGFDTDGTFTSDFAAFKAAAGWTAPERDIVSYMESVDPTYVVNEDVYVDEDAVIKQANRQKVWEVLASPSKSGNLAMSPERAKQVARRYHAFVTFIQRAKANRKGAWDPRWTAEAVNNYIREGFGKAPVTGPYVTTLSDLANYTPVTP
jgi:hypothetical protein